MKIINGGVTAPKGFLAGSTNCGIKKSGKTDLALLYSAVPCMAAGTFTTNRVKSGSVVLSIQRLKKGMPQAIIVNSGNANACTGKQGVINAEKMCAVTASELGIKPEAIMVSSTGRIGVQLPLHIIEPGIAKAAAALAAGAASGSGQSAGLEGTKLSLGCWLSIAEAASLRLDLCGSRFAGFVRGRGVI